METPLDPRKCEVCETKLIEIDELVPDRDSFRL
jgi:hypothetical protein